MSELVGGAAAVETLGGSAAEAGALMRRAREALGLRIEVLAASLKVSVAKLEALESRRPQPRNFGLREVLERRHALGRLLN